MSADAALLLQAPCMVLCCPACQGAHPPSRATCTLHLDFVGVQVFDWVKNHGGEPIIPFSGSFENKLVEMPQDEQETFCKEVRHQSAAMPPLSGPDHFNSIWAACSVHCLLMSYWLLGA